MICHLLQRADQKTQLYFDGHLADDKHQIRFVRFRDKLHEDLSEFHQKREPILLRNCNLYKENNDCVPQVSINKGRTTIHKSESVFDIETDDYHSHPSRPPNAPEICQSKCGSKDSQSQATYGSGTRHEETNSESHHCRQNKLCNNPTVGGRHEHPRGGLGAVLLKLHNEWKPVAFAS